jgi:glucose-6-phosphate 1-dehydrogenase
MGKTDKLPPTILVIFGISGDLAQRYLLPALAKINKNEQLPEDFRLLGITRQDLHADDVLKGSCKSLGHLAEIFRMDLSSSDSYQALKQKLDELGEEYSEKPQVIFYFAVPPSATLPIIRQLGAAKLNHSQTKLLLEKPFGVDLASATELIDETDKHFKEEQVYRIDHYLAKEMAQNIAVFLGGNVLFRDVWNNQFINRIEVVAAEKIDIEGRVNFYEQSGALRDLVQSHLLQLTALVLMKPCPDVFDFSEVRRRRLDALNQLKVAGHISTSVARGQYKGYRQEVDNPDSEVETFVALRLISTDKRWQGVPIDLVTGKALDRKFTGIKVYFKKSQAQEANKLTLRIQPEEGIELELWVKKPGYDHNLEKMPLDFNYEQYFGSDLPEAYEQVIVDAMRTRPDLFASSEEVLATWRLLEPVQKHWSMTSGDLHFYEKGSDYKKLASSWSIIKDL